MPESLLSPESQGGSVLNRTTWTKNPEGQSRHYYHKKGALTTNIHLALGLLTTAAPCHSYQESVAKQFNTTELLATSTKLDSPKGQISHHLTCEQSAFLGPHLEKDFVISIPSGGTQSLGGAREQLEGLNSVEA